MVNKKDKREEEIKVTKDCVKLDKVFQDLYKKISNNTYDTDRELNTDQIKNLVNRIDDVINSDLEELKEYGGKNDLTRFLLVTLQNSGKYNGVNDDETLENIFLSKDGSIFSVFEERFKNRLLLFHDLETVCDQLPELREAIYTTKTDESTGAQTTSISVNEADYGVVRNHYYQALINKVENLGSAVYDPDEIIIPNNEDKETYYIGAQIYILSWKIVKQDVEL